jgi:hypothetical protein
MKYQVCDICLKQSTHNDPKLSKAAYKLSLKSAIKRITLDACENHKDWLRHRNGETFSDIEAELSAMENCFYGIRKSELIAAKAIEKMNATKSEAPTTQGGAQ